MRILVLSWRDIGNPRAGGAERVTFEHARRWVAAGHEVTLFTANYPGAAACDTLDGLHIVRRGTETTVHIAAQHWYRRLRQRPDVVVDEIHGVPFCALAYAGVPVVASIFEVARDIWYSMYPFPMATAGRLAETTTLRWYGRAGVPFLTDSPSTASDLDLAGVPRRNVTVVTPGISRAPLTELPIKGTDPTLIYVGRLVRMKGIEDALAALSLIRQRLPTARLWIVGKGDAAYEALLRHRALDLGIGDAVQFLGRVSEDEKYRLLACAHVLVHPSQREGWGINVIEANAMATPAVGYRVPGLQDSIVDGETGWLCRRGDPGHLAEAVCFSLAASDRYHRTQRAALAWSERFTWDEAAAATLRVLASRARCSTSLVQQEHVGHL